MGDMPPKYRRNQRAVAKVCGRLAFVVETDDTFITNGDRSWIVDYVEPPRGNVNWWRVEAPEGHIEIIEKVPDFIPSMNQIERREYARRQGPDDI